MGKIFQYNTCFGSTVLNNFDYLMAFKFQYNTCFGSTCKSWYRYNRKRRISIQHLFRFDILSIPHHLLFCNFNTTLVSVRLFSSSYSLISFGDFNTTLVSVRLLLTKWDKHNETDFNTTLVSVRHMTL